MDVVLTASQKAVGVPPGLALMVVSERAMEKWRNRKSPVGNYYGDWNNWLPIMTAYLERRPSYFGTPAVNLVEALNVSLTEILTEGMEARFARHRRIGRGIRAALNSMGLDQVPDNDSIAANTLSAPYYPEGVDGPSLLREIAALGVTLAGGLHPVNRQKYFRIGHMGIAAGNDLVSTIAAIGTALNRCGFKSDTGEAVNALLAEL